MWYCRYEVQVRQAYFFSAASVAGAFSGLLAYGISYMEGMFSCRRRSAIVLTHLMQALAGWQVGDGESLHPIQMISTDLNQDLHPRRSTHLPCRNHRLLCLGRLSRDGIFPDG